MPKYKEDLLQDFVTHAFVNNEINEKDWARLMELSSEYVSGKDDYI